MGLGRTSNFGYLFLRDHSSFRSIQVSLVSFRNSMSREDHAIAQSSFFPLMPAYRRVLFPLLYFQITTKHAPFAFSGRDGSAWSQLSTWLDDSGSLYAPFQAPVPWPNGTQTALLFVRRRQWPWLADSFWRKRAVYDHHSNLSLYSTLTQTGKILTHHYPSLRLEITLTECSRPRHRRCILDLPRQPRWPSLLVWSGHCYILSSNSNTPENPSSLLDPLDPTCGRLSAGYLGALPLSRSMIDDETHLGWADTQLGVYVAIPFNTRRDENIVTNQLITFLLAQTLGML